MHQSSKWYGHEIGFSCAFRQWRAKSHCNKTHGYSMGFFFLYEARELDQNNWVVDFGSMKSLKGMLEDTFDHKMIVAEDDPLLEYFKEGERLGAHDLRILPNTGCEKFAEYVFGATDVWLLDNGYKPRVNLVKVSAHEHGANSAVYINPDFDISNLEDRFQRKQIHVGSPL